jgi:hypothetical protein
MCASGGEKADEPRHSHSHTHTHTHGEEYIEKRRSILGVVWREAHRVTEEEVGSLPREKERNKRARKGDRRDRERRQNERWMADGIEKTGRA